MVATRRANPEISAATNETATGSSSTGAESKAKKSQSETSDKHKKPYKGVKAQEVFDTAELLEHILLDDDLDMKTVLLSQQVNKTFQTTIRGSTKLQQKLWLKRAPSSANKGMTLNPLLNAPLPIENVPFTHVNFLASPNGLRVFCIRGKRRVDLEEQSREDMLVVRTKGKKRIAVSIEGDAAPVELYVECKKDITVEELMEVVRRQVG